MKDDADDRIHVRRTETVSEGHYTLRRVTFEQIRGDGKRQELTRDVYCIGEGAAVLPVDPRRGTVLLVRQLRIPALVSGASPFLIEACAGNVEHGDSPAETVRKEAEQEMGRRVRNLRKVFTLYASPGATTERIHLFVADYASAEHAGEGGGVPGEGEEIETLEVPLERAWEMVRSGEIADAKTVLLLQHLHLGRG